MNGHFIPMSNKLKHQPTPSQQIPPQYKTISPMRSAQQNKHQTPINYHVSINLKPTYQHQYFKPQEKDRSSKGNTSSQKTLDYSSQGTQRLTLVKSPSTSFSPFRKHCQKPEPKFPKVQNVRISLQKQPPQQQIPKLNQQYHQQSQQRLQSNLMNTEKLFKDSNRSMMESTQQLDISHLLNQQPHKLQENQNPDNNYYVRSQQQNPLRKSNTYLNKNKTAEIINKSIQGESVLNETIDKLDYLERKISSIMQKNDQLRSLLKRQDPPKIVNQLMDDSFTGNVNMNSINQNQSSFIQSSNKVNLNTSNQHCGSVIQSFNQYLQSQGNQASQEDTNLSINQYGPIDRGQSFYSRGSCPQSKGHQSKKSYSKSLNKLVDKSSLLNSCDTLQSFFQNGRGKKIYPNNYMYEGEWLDGVRQGLGTLFSPMGSIVYQGEWKQDSYHGRGRLVNEISVPLEENETFTIFKTFMESWKTYEGEFKEGLKHGLGVMNFGNYKYHGHFEQDFLHGTGSVINESDSKQIIRGIWENGDFKK